MSQIRDLRLNYPENGNITIRGFTWMENLSPLKPIVFEGLPENTELLYYWGGKGFPRIKTRFTAKNMQLYKYATKTGIEYVVSYGTIFQCNYPTYKPLFIICESNNEITYVVDKQSLSIPGLGGIIKKFLATLEYPGDIIYTDNVASYCFMQQPKVTFKTFKLQRAYYQHIADEWCKSENEKNKKIVGEVEEDYSDEELDSEEGVLDENDEISTEGENQELVELAETSTNIDNFPF